MQQQVINKLHTNADPTHTHTQIQTKTSMHIISTVLFLSWLLDTVPVASIKEYTNIK